ncbi:Uncharacterised protein [Rodentibacter pneumotropicus]|uniref:Uncharacterized protein n=1 Tax=Rodentibacter pneumotropicus TaxID=758 RepID=A0A3S4TU65_9PAST|nr:Uncharacterised protein [Rodentibacter pneumotropicus]
MLLLIILIYMDIRIENMLFLRATNGTFIHGVLAEGEYTIGSLKLMLTKPDIAKWK